MNRKHHFECSKCGSRKHEVKNGTVKCWHCGDVTPRGK